MLRIAEFRAPDYTIRQYRPAQALSGDITVHLDIMFGDLVMLEGYQLSGLLEQGNPRPEDVLVVELFWRPLRQAERDLTVFVHLVGPARSDGSPLWAQEDHLPQRGRTNTSSWPTGVLLRDAYQLVIPTDAPPAQYQLVVGLYDPETNQRITAIQNAAVPYEGAALLDTFEIRAR